MQPQSANRAVDRQSCNASRRREPTARAAAVRPARWEGARKRLGDTEPCCGLSTSSSRQRGGCLAVGRESAAMERRLAVGGELPIGKPDHQMLADVNFHDSESLDERSAKGGDFCGNDLLTGRVSDVDQTRFGIGQLGAQLGLVMRQTFVHQQATLVLLDRLSDRAASLATKRVVAFAAFVVESIKAAFAVHIVPLSYSGPCLTVGVDYCVHMHESTDRAMTVWNSTIPSRNSWLIYWIRGGQ